MNIKAFGIIVFLIQTSSIFSEVEGDDLLWVKSITKEKYIYVVKDIEYEEHESKWIGKVDSILRGDGASKLVGKEFSFSGVSREFAKGSAVIYAYTPDKNGKTVSSVRLKETIINYQRLLRYLLHRDSPVVGHPPQSPK